MVRLGMPFVLGNAPPTTPDASRLLPAGKHNETPASPLHLGERVLKQEHETFLNTLNRTVVAISVAFPSNGTSYE